MFYQPKNRDHGLPYDPFKALVIPRPIGWVSTVSPSGAVNLAPYSFFNAVAASPPMVMFASEGAKDSYRNVRETGEFCCNIVSLDLMEKMSQTSAPLPHEDSEFGFAGLTPEPAALVRPPRVKEAKAVLECKATQLIQLPGVSGLTENYMVIGEVIGVHIDDDVIVDGKVDPQLIRIVARLGYKHYSVTDNVFEMARPTGGGDLKKLG